MYLKTMAHHHNSKENIDDLLGISRCETLKPYITTRNKLLIIMITITITNKQIHRLIDFNLTSTGEQDGTQSIKMTSVSSFQNYETPHKFLVK